MATLNDKVTVRLNSKNSQINYLYIEMISMKHLVAFEEILESDDEFNVCRHGMTLLDHVLVLPAFLKISVTGH